MNGCGPFHVERTAPINKAITKLTAKGRHGPARRIGHHHVRMAEQINGRLLPSPLIFTLEKFMHGLAAASSLPWRIGGIDAN